MKKSFNILLALVITFFTLPFGGMTVLADGEDYGNIEDGEYEITAKAINIDTGERSGAAGFIKEAAKLNIKDGDIEFTIIVPHSEGAKVTGLQVEGIEPTVEIEDDAESMTYKLQELKSELVSQVQYTVDMPGMKFDHDVPFLFVLEGLDNLPVKDKGEDIEEPKEPETPEQPEDPKEENNNGLIVDADEAYELEYVTDTPMIERYFDKSVNLLIKDDKKYIQMHGNSAEYIKSLTINGKEVVWGEIQEDNTYIFQFEIEGYLKDKLDFGMIIDTGNPQFGEMEHNVSLSFGTRAEINEPTPVNAGEKVLVNDTQVTMPEDLPENATVKITKKETVENQGDLEVAGEVYEFEFANLGDYDGQFELVMGYDQDKYNKEDVDIYYYNEENNKWEAQNGTAENGLITVDVDHFSTYGVFADKPEEPVEEPGDSNDGTPTEVPEDAEEIDYVIMHENGEDESTANSYFIKPGLLFEKDGHTYVQVTLTNGDMIKELSSEFGDAVVVNDHEDGSIDVQFMVNGDLSDTLLEMRIVVPGVYEETHEAIFSIKLDEEPQNEDPKEEPKEDPKTPIDEKVEAIPDKAYEIDYVVKHATDDEASAADRFFRKPGILLEKDGQKYLQLTIDSWDMIDWLRTEHGGDVLLVKENDDGSAIVQIKIDGELSEVINLNMKITVPGMYSMEHDARLVLNPNDLTEVDPNDYQIVIDKEELEKPEFGPGSDNDNNDQKPVKTDKTDNPQTGDKTNLLLYTMLLIGSLIPLAVKLRRRFV